MRGSNTQEIFKNLYFQNKVIGLSTEYLISILNKIKKMSEFFDLLVY